MIKGKQTKMFLSSIIIETFSVHYALTTPKKNLKNLDVGVPLAGLALATTAVRIVSLVVCHETGFSYF